MNPSALQMASGSVGGEDPVRRGESLGTFMSRNMRSVVTIPQIDWVIANVLRRYMIVT
jgi:hypothetical protein